MFLCKVCFASVMFIATSLSYYKRSEVQEAILAQAQDKEISVMFGQKKFGKRPDMISYPSDILEFAKKKVSSFHCSEELWINPLAIETGMTKQELNAIRKGWDLILDIDCPNWEFSKVITHLFVKALQDHGIHAVTVKFSGNKGFHIAVPFESFPHQITYEGQMIESKDLFPDGPRKIAVYLLSYITEKYANVLDDKVLFIDDLVFSFDYLQSVAKQSAQSLFAYRCTNQHCLKVVESPPSLQKKYVYQCEQCGHISIPEGNPEYISCQKCAHPVEPKIEQEGCMFCGHTQQFEKILNLLSVIDVDTVLIASRHLYRMPYSLHEKSGLVSIPISLNEILTFDKERAKPELVTFSVPFLDRSQAISGEASRLVIEAFDYTYKEVEQQQRIRKPFEVPKDAISEEFFPPCILRIAKGLEDGKKRALFILINFLQSVGWSYDQIEHYVYEWNTKNPEPLREQYLKGQLHQIKKNKEVILPPRCTNKDYYTSLLICNPDLFCQKIKNPAQYSKKKMELSSKSKKKVKKPKKNEN